MLSFKKIKEELEAIVGRTEDYGCFNGKTILVTGANGHIASWIAMTFIYMKRCKGLDLTIMLLSRSREKLMELYQEVAEDVVFIVADVATVSPEMFDDNYPDYIFHFAGNASPFAIKNDPIGIMHANIDGTEAMARLSLSKRGCRLVFAGSREVYGEVKDVDRLTEDDFGRVAILEPRSCYPESKRAAEALLEAYHNQLGLDFCVVRIAHCYGPGMKTKNDGRVMQDLLGYALAGEDIVLNSDGSALRAFCYVGDVVNAVIAVAVKGQPGEAYNVSNEREEISIKGLAELISSIKGGIKVVYGSGEFDRTAYCSYKRIGLDTSKIETLGWKPFVGIRDGLIKTLSLDGGEEG